MTEEQNKINHELYELREEFIKKHSIDCSTCEHFTKSGRCGSRLKCIVNEQVFFSPYKKKE